MADLLAGFAVAVEQIGSSSVEGLLAKPIIDRHRVAHAHVVEHLGEQWREYLRLRDLLRRSPGARQRYEDAKLRLVNEVGDDRKTYTDRKTEIVASLLGEA